MRILAADAGNSNIVLGCMDGLEVRQTIRLETDRTQDASGYATAIRRTLAQSGYPVELFEGAILSSVVASVTRPLQQALSSLIHGKVLTVGQSAKSVVQVRLPQPDTVGSDLIAAAEGALAHYAPPLILVDMGTATTFSVLDKDGAFLGGAIAPGVRLGADALSQKTGLQTVAMTPPQNPLGRSTEDCLRSGILLGSAAMVDGMLERLEDALGMPATAIATGGLAGCIVPCCQRHILLDDDLLLRGLAIMYRRSLQQ